MIVSPSDAVSVWLAWHTQPYWGYQAVPVVVYRAVQLNQATEPVLTTNSWWMVRCATQGQCTSPSVTYQLESHRAKTDKEEISPNNYEGLVDWVLFIVWKCLMWLPFFEHFLFTLRETKAFSRVHNLYQCMKCFSTDLLSNWSLCQGLLCKLISLQAALFAIFFSFKLFFFWIVLLSS